MVKYKYFYDGEDRTLPEIAKLLGVNYNPLLKRIKRGMSFEKAINKPFRSITGITSLNETKICTICKIEKPRTSFYKLKRRSGTEITAQCILCDKERVYEARRVLRSEVVAHYSNGESKCSICSEIRLDVLDIDHINGGGNKHRTKFKNIYQHLKDENYPQGYRVLCRNCNWIAWIERKDRDIEIRNKEKYS